MVSVVESRPIIAVSCLIIPSWTPKVWPKTSKNSPKGHYFTYFGGPGYGYISHKHGEDFLRRLLRPGVARRCGCTSGPELALGSAPAGQTEGL